MKITYASTTLVALPQTEPLADGPTTPGSKNFVALKLGTDQGVEGIGFTFFGGSLDKALLTAVQAFGEALFTPRVMAGLALIAFGAPNLFVWLRENRPGRPWDAAL